MKKYLIVILVVTVIFSSTGCRGKMTDTDAGAVAPSLILLDASYTAPYMPVDELPEGYEYMGIITDEMANDTGLSGCRYYVDTRRDSLNDLYVYQECGTPIDDNTVDNEKRQWAYVHWVRTSSSKVLETNEALENDQDIKVYTLKTEKEVLILPQITLNTREKTFSFSYDVLSSYLTAGAYEQDEEKLVLKTKDGEYHYTFEMIDENTLRFDQENSSEIGLIDKNIGAAIEDGAEFRLNR